MQWNKSKSQCYRIYKHSELCLTKDWKLSREIRYRHEMKYKRDNVYTAESN